MYYLCSAQQSANYDRGEGSSKYVFSARQPKTFYHPGIRTLAFNSRSTIGAENLFTAWRLWRNVCNCTQPAACTQPASRASEMLYAAWCALWILVVGEPFELFSNGCAVPMQARVQAVRRYINQPSGHHYQLKILQQIGNGEHPFSPPHCTPLCSSHCGA